MIIYFSFLSVIFSLSKGQAQAPKYAPAPDSLLATLVNQPAILFSCPTSFNYRRPVVSTWHGGFASMACSPLHGACERSTVGDHRTPNRASQTRSSAADTENIAFQRRGARCRFGANVLLLSSDLDFRSSTSLLHIVQPRNRTSSTYKVRLLLRKNTTLFSPMLSHVTYLSAEVRLKYSLSASESADLHGRLSHDTPAVKGDAHCWVFTEEMKKKKNVPRVCLNALSFFRVFQR